jgi:hypothetical protein
MSESNDQSFKLAVTVENIKFDPEDDLTKAIQPESVSYFVFLDSTLVGVLTPARNKSSLDVQLNSKNMKSNGVVRIIARDSDEVLNGVEEIREDNSSHIGTISFGMEYFRNLIPAQLNTPLKSWITLFDDVDDDEFDGEFGEDDEELPMILTTFALSEVE